MKKLIAIIFISAAALLAVPKVHAQGQQSLKNAAGRVLDTVTNTGTKTLTSQPIVGRISGVTVTESTVNISGSQSGIARLFGSLDGVTYYRVRSTMLHNSQVDSLVITTAPTAQNYAWFVDGNPFNYYQIQVTGVGTVSFSVKGKIKSN